MVQTCAKGHAPGEAITEFADAYAAQNQRHYKAFMAPIADGRLEVDGAEA